MPGAEGAAGASGSGMQEWLLLLRAPSGSRYAVSAHCHGALTPPSPPNPNSPHRPKYKGKYCVGERKRFRLCNLQACPAGRPSFRQVQCSHFDAMLYKGQLHTWVPVVNDGESCHPWGH